MNDKWAMRIVLVGLIVGATGWPASAQSDAAGGDEAKNARRTVEGFWEPSSILKMAVNNLARRYNLNEQQRAITDKMMTERVNRFIEEHQEEVWPLLRDLALLQRQGATPDPAKAGKLGPVALKIVREAKREIFKSNEEWREILTDEQKKLHDWDLREMTDTFGKMERNFESWSAGNPQSGRIFPAPKKGRSQPPQPPKPNERGTLHLSPESNPELDVQFDVYVRNFIRDYGLRVDQVDAANSVLREVKQRAAQFRAANYKAIQEVKDKIAQASDVRERKVWDDKRKALMRPIGVLFAELKDRLNQVPDQAQRDRYKLRAESGSKSGKVSSAKAKRPRATKVSRNDKAGANSKD